MQQKILECLMKAGEPLGRSEIAERIKCRPVTVSVRLKQMVKSGQLICIEIDRFTAMERFKAKRRMRLYLPNPDF